MGPRSDERGNAMNCTGNGFNITLQWGRVRMNAEMRRQVEIVRLAGEASMGPRSDERGNCQGKAKSGDGF